MWILSCWTCVGSLVMDDVQRKGERPCKGGDSCVCNQCCNTPVSCINAVVVCIWMLLRWIDWVFQEHASGMHEYCHLGLDEPGL